MSFCQPSLFLFGLSLPCCFHWNGMDAQWMMFVFTKQLNSANAYGWIASASASASAKVTQKLLFIAFHISQEFYSIRTDNVQNSLMLKCIFLHARTMNFFFLVRSMCFLTQPSIACPLQWNRNNIRLNRFSCVHFFSLWYCLSLNLIINI